MFGNTEGHVKLRRELLTEHLVEGIISLPGGVFQPYTGVKTSILIFQKETRKQDRNKWQHVDTPRTQTVWFYEVEQEAFSLDAKRNEHRGQDNDLWDMLAKYKERHTPEEDELNYYQPQYRTERWRMIDEHSLSTFSNDPRVVSEKDQIRSIQELFPELPADPEAAHAQVIQEQQPVLDRLALEVMNNAATDAAQKAASMKRKERRADVADKALKKAASTFRSLCEKQRGLFDKEERIALSLYQKAYQAASAAAKETYSAQILEGLDIQPENFNEEDVLNTFSSVAREFAKLDGYDVVLRTLEVFKHEATLKEPKHWVAPVRVLARDDDWTSENGEIKGTHDETGNVRPEYLASIQLYDEKGNLIEGLLDPDCIEARNWNLSAGQYKPFTFAAVKSDKSVAEMIRELKEQEKNIIEGLGELLAMLGES